MNIKKKFLTLSIRHQIIIVVIIISIFCLLSILALFSLYTNIIVSIQSRKRKEYYFQKYKEIIDSEIRFQSFLLYQYEQIIKGFNSQIYHYSSKIDLSEPSFSYQNNLIKYYKDTTEDDYDPNLPDDEKIYFLLSFSDDEYLNNKIYFYLSNIYPSINNKLKGIRNFRISYFGKNISIIDEYVFILLQKKNLFSINRTRINEIEEISNSNYSGYYNDLINEYVNKYKNYMNAYKRGELKFMDIFFENKFNLFTNYVNETYLRQNYNSSVREYLNNISSNFQFIDYSTGETFITDSGDKNNVKFLEQNKIISDYINFIFSKIQNSLNINVIPVFNENNTIMSVDLCYAFLYKQIMFHNLTANNNVFDEEKLNIIYNSLKKGESNIGDCILNKKYDYDTSQNVYDILNIKFDKFYSIKNTRESSLFKLSGTFIGENYFCTKYTFPDFTSILNFKPTFLTLDQLNLYCFKSFYEPQHYFNNMMNFFTNCQYIVIICLLYLWILVCFYLLFRLNKLFKEIIDPINNLSEAINKIEIKEENMLKYEADDSINELFKLCNDLLLGKYKQKMVHESELEKGNFDQNDGGKNINDFNNLKINRKLIEEMVENKNEYNIKEDEIKTFNVNECPNNKGILIRDNIKTSKDIRKTTIIKRKVTNPTDVLNQINKIQKDIKKTQSINQAINLLNKKMSYDVNLLFKSENLISTTENQSEEDILEIEVLLNYKHLYDIVDLVFNYDLKYDKKFISKNSKLLFKSNLRNYNKYHRAKSKVKIATDIEEDNKIKIENDKITTYEKEIKEDAKIRIEEFDKSVINTYETKDILFLWYEEAKYFKGIQFLQTNHTKELNNLCNLFGNENKVMNNKQLNNNNNININNSIRHKKITFLKKVNKETNKVNSENEDIRKSKTNV